MLPETYNEPCLAVFWFHTLQKISRNCRNLLPCRSLRRYTLNYRGMQNRHSPVIPACPPHLRGPRILPPGHPFHGISAQTPDVVGRHSTSRFKLAPVSEHPGFLLARYGPTSCDVARYHTTSAAQEIGHPLGGLSEHSTDPIRTRYRAGVHAGVRASVLHSSCIAAVARLTIRNR